LRLRINSIFVAFVLPSSGLNRHNPVESVVNCQRNITLDGRTNAIKMLSMLRAYISVVLSIYSIHLCGAACYVRGNSNNM